MALLMVHLMAAEGFAKHYPEFSDSPEFFLGAISPDAIHIRDGSDKSRKDEIHLYNWRCVNTQRVFDYWAEHGSAFDIGYGVHVLTDGQWVPRFRTRLSGMLGPNGRLNTDIYYNDTFVTDFHLRDTQPETARWFDLLRRAVPPEDHPLLSAYEIGKWRDDMLKAYSEPCPKNEPPRYVTEPYVRAFVPDCMDMMIDTYRRAFIDE